MIKVAIIGAKGYAGRELVRLCIQHPEIDLVALTDLVDKPEPISSIFPELRKVSDIMVEPTNVERIIQDTEAIFLALPHKASQDYAGDLIRAGKIVFDLSADFRFSDIATYERTYKITHKEPDIAKEAVYGLAEFNRARIKSAQLIGVAGCYPTGALLGILPVVAMGLNIRYPIIVDAKSGVSGAGRTPTAITHFPACNESLMAYGIGTHRHQPEILEKVRETACAKQEIIEIVFTPHLVPMDRGILSTVYINLADEVAEKTISAAFAQHYDNEQFVRLLPEGTFPATKNVIFTNFCDIGWKKVSEHTLIVVTAIDNLVKGASGQAIQCFNIRYGIQETIGFF